MKKRLADYVADFLADAGITDCFTVTGGGAMHLNDAFGHHPKMQCTYNHHEQACAIAAEGYARLNNKTALVCVTSGPGGTNALTGVVGGWLDSVSMLIISGQVRYDTTARYNERFTDGLKLRALGDQEFDITKAASSMCKYAVMIEDPKQIRYELERAMHFLKTGRPGPVWIDIPVNFQGAYIEVDKLESYHGSRDENADLKALPPKVSDKTIETVLEKIKNAKRPVLYAGNGIRLSGAYEEFRKAVELLGVPVCTFRTSVDLIETEHPLYCGRGGSVGDRAGNFAVQNSDLLLVVGNRLSIRVVGYNWKTWAREAEVIMVDIDEAELKKSTIHVEFPIHADAKDFLNAIIKKCEGTKTPVFTGENWIKICQNWKKNYPVVLERHWDEDGNFANVYATFDYISKTIPEGTLTVSSVGACAAAGHQSWYIKKDTRFFTSNGAASMGYGLPAAIGACVANDRKPMICLEGDGSIMMNLQELQTVVTNRLPIKIFLINNAGYHSIRQTQNNIFAGRSKVGIGPESADLTFPSFKKIAYAFDIPYYEAHSNAEMKKAVDNTLNEPSFVMCEIFVSTTQFFEPKSAAKKLPDGTIISPPLEDMAPFLPREELLKNLYIKPLF
ncbi:MAG: thiamine pyrophosphate-binding protein [Ruminococcaceae bacterium]|nr:thiamine pyrophosphate-binding protein [Oscillospiraceae bacterium]